MRPIRFGKRRNLWISLCCLVCVYFILKTMFRVPVKENVINAQSPLIFIGGVPRSGTTLLRVMLDSHPDIRIGPETHIIPEALNQRERFEFSRTHTDRFKEAGITTSILDSLLQKFILDIIQLHDYPAKYLGDKDPFNLRYMMYLRYLFPNSKYILMLRDGRAVVHSLMTRNVFVGEFDTKNETNCLINWNRAVGEMYAQCVKVGSLICLPVYYEQLILYPEWNMREILKFLGIRWDSSVLRHEKYVNSPRGAKLSKWEKSTDQVIHPLQQSSMWRWAKNFTRRSPQQLRYLAPMLETLGYDVTASPPVYSAMSPDVKKNILHLTKNKHIYQILTRSAFDKFPYFIDSDYDLITNSFLQGSL